MERIKLCPFCGGVIEFEENYDTSYNDEEVVVSCVGGCSTCERDYFYDDVYKFSHITNIQRRNEYV